MNKLKFRIWDRDLKEMYNPEEIIVQIKGEEILICHAESLHQFTNYALLQSTGLNGEDGVEIYEGDIVIYDRNISDTVDRFPYVVIYNEGNFVLEYGLIQHNLFNNTEYVTVIGNIYENPELLGDN